MYPPEQILPPHNLPLFSTNPSEPNFNSSSRFEDLHQLASSSFYFPNSPYFQYNEDHFFNELTWEQLHQSFPSLTDQAAMQNPCQAPNPKQDAAAPQNNNVERKRPTKKDRHSKITTAKGPRDRRMRLSLDVARKFFDLQDVLGYDKASKTVEWLLIQANSAIDEVSQGYTALATSVSSTQSECEVVSGIEDASATTTASAAVKGGGKKPEKKAKVVSAKRTRESRKEARERARKRTLERKTPANIDLKQCSEGGCWGSVDESLGHKDVDDISVITRNWNPRCIYQQDAAPQISHVNDELSEFQYCGKVWGGYNNI